MPSSKEALNTLISESEFALIQVLVAFQGEHNSRAKSIQGNTVVINGLAKNTLLGSRHTKNFVCSDLVFGKSPLFHLMHPHRDLAVGDRRLCSWSVCC